MINIAIAPDDNYAKVAAVAITSLFENQNDDICIYLVYLEGALTESNRSKLSDIADKYQSHMQIVCIKKEFIQNFPFISHLGFSTYLRLFLSWTLPNVDRIIYLDCDIIVEEPLDTLYNINIGSCCLAAVADYHSKNFYHLQSIGFNHPRPYVNAGVLLMNLKPLRQYDMQKDIEDYLKYHCQDICFADQDIINVLFPNIFILHPRYNVNMFMWQVPAIFPLPWNKKEKKEALENPVIIHFLGKGKPWQGIRVRFAERWWHYVELTPPAIKDSFMMLRGQSLKPSKTNRFRFYKEGLRNSVPSWLLKPYYKTRLCLWAKMN